MNLKHILPLGCLLLLLAACSTPRNVLYFQDAQAYLSDSTWKDWSVKMATQKITISPGDKLNIVVSSAQTPDLAFAFNKIAPSASNNGSGATSSENVMPYIVDAEGNIVLPQIGTINVKGYTRSELEEVLRARIAADKHLRDAIVSVEVLNQYVSVLGEVAQPGRVYIDKDNLNVLEAISRTGDLKIMADREQVFVMREVNKKVTAHRIDLTNTLMVHSSPAYQLLPGDVVYVKPNKHRIRESEEYGNVWKQPSIYISLVTVLTAIASLAIFVF